MVRRLSPSLLRNANLSEILVSRPIGGFAEFVVTGNTKGNWEKETRQHKFR